VCVYSKKGLMHYCDDAMVVGLGIPLFAPRAEGESGRCGSTAGSWIKMKKMIWSGSSIFRPLFEQKR